MADDGNSAEQAHLEELRETKRRVLHELDMQAEQLGVLTPPHIHLERKRLREELGIVEKVILSPLGPMLSDELGEKWRYVSYLEQVRKLDQTVERLEARVTAFIEGSMAWRWRITIIVLSLVAIVVVAIIIGAYWIGRIDSGNIRAALVALLRR